MAENTELVGYMKTRMVWSASEKQWQILDIVNERLLGYSEYSLGLPIGSHKWNITERNCTDSGTDLRTLLMHVAVEQPGHFCCSDGQCFESEFRCDNIFHCKDHSDEKNCGILALDGNYNTVVPPFQATKRKKDNKITQAKIHVSFLVDNIIAMIKEVESEYSVL